MVEGLWTISEMRMGVGWNAKMGGPVNGVDLPVPVVPCDGAAINRAAKVLYTQEGGRGGWDAEDWDTSPEREKDLYRERITHMFRAAGETP